MATFENEAEVGTQIHTQNVAGSSVTVHVYGSSNNNDGSGKKNSKSATLVSGDTDCVIADTSSQSRRGQSHTSAQAPCLIPYNRNRSFISRSPEMKRLYTLLDPNHIANVGSSPRLAILHGLGGIGKTSLATEFAYQHQERNPSSAILWIHANTNETVYQSLARIATGLGIDAEDDQTDLVARVAAWLSHKSNPPWLMIIDNADDVDIILRSHKHLFDSLSRCSHGSLLLTTRTRKLAMRVTSRLGKPDATVAVRPMEKDEAFLLIKSSSGLDLNWSSSNSHFDKASAQAIAELVGYLPLALVQAGTYVRENFISLEKYVQMWNVSARNAQDLLEFEFDTEGRSSIGAEIPNAVAAALILSLDLLAQKNQIASELLSSMTFFHHNSIPESLLLDDEMNANDVSFVSALGELTALSLISRNVSAQTIEVHRIVHIVAYRWQIRRESSEDLNTRATKILTRLNGLFLRYSSKKDRPKLDIIIPHAISYLACNTNTSQVNQKAKISLERKTAEHLLYQGRTSQAAGLRIQALYELSEISDPASTEVLRAKHEVAAVFKHLRQLEQAEALCRDVIQSCAKAEHTAYGSILHINSTSLLCDILAEKKLYQEAYKQIDAARQAASVRHSNDDEISIRLEYQAAQIKRQQAQDLPPVETTSRLSLLVESKKLLLLARARAEGASGGKSSLSLVGTQYLAAVLNDLDEVERAEAMYQLVATNKAEILGPTHVETFQAKRNLVMFYLAHSLIDSASKTLVDLLPQQQSVLDKRHPEYLKARRCLARLYEQQANLLGPQIQEQRDRMRVKKSLLDQACSDAKEVDLQIAYQRSKLSIRESELESEVYLVRQVQPIHHITQHEQMLKDLENQKKNDKLWNEVDSRLQRLLDEALSNQTRVVEMQAELKTLENLVEEQLQPAIKLMRDAINEQQEVLQAMMEVLGPEQPETLDLMSECAKTIQKALLLDRSVFAKFTNTAYQLLEDVVEQQCHLHEDHNHEDVLSAKALLAAHFHDQLRYKEAQSLEEQVLAGEKHRHGTHHARTLAAMHALAETHAAQGTRESRSAAIALLDKCCKISISVLGAGHPDTQPRFELFDKCKSERSMYDDSSSASRSSRIMRDMEGILAVRSSVIYNTPRFSPSVASRNQSRNWAFSHYLPTRSLKKRETVPTALNIVRGFNIGEAIGGRAAENAEPNPNSVSDSSPGH